jgi:hypothetical protein
MSKKGADKKAGVDELLSLLARGQDLLERAHETLRAAERVRAEVGTSLAPPPPPLPPAPPLPAPITFPWPAQASSGDAGATHRA